MKKSQLKSIIFIGPQGSGKGTQAFALAKKLGYNYFSTGNEFNKIRQENSKLGTIIRSYYDKGLLVPDKITQQTVKYSLNKIKIQKGVIFDGFPRNLLQAKQLLKILEEYCLSSLIVIYLDINKNTAIKRLEGRKICSSCGKIHSIQDTLNNHINCLNCQSKLVSRADDELKAIIKRLDLYYQETKPLINFYKKKNILIEIDGEQSIKHVSEDIYKRIMSYYASKK